MSGLHDDDNAALVEADELLQRNARVCCLCECFVTMFHCHYFIFGIYALRCCITYFEAC